MKKKLTALALVICLLAVAVVGGTMAYFTDEDTKTNTFTTGDVVIEVREESDENGTPFTQDQKLLPGVLVNKYVYIDNKGPNDAYVRANIMWPSQYDDATGIQFWRYWYTKWSFPSGSKDAATYPSELTTKEIDGVLYTCLTFYCDEAVPAGATAGGFRLLSTYYIPDTFDWVDKEAGIYSVGNGTEKVIVECDHPEIPLGLTVTAEAIQADGFADVWEAFAAYDVQN